VRLFVYGTLLDTRRLTRFAGRAVVPFPAELTGWRRVALRGTPYPTLRRGRGMVAGGLIVADAALLRRLSIYEGARYSLVPVAVRALRDETARPVRAFAWIACGATRRAWN
jgi:gamma-glutamylcyclotransferase (GGCT)/AIG2-like uncharacterized protein YtfP